jgi:4-hydroxythreonine-4-phosphate dehydrogenase
MVKVLALTLGDRYGVGPELVAQLLATLPSRSDMRVAVLGDRRVFDRGRATKGLSGGYPTVGSLADMQSLDEPWALIHRPFEAETEPLGRVEAAAGREVLETLGSLIEAATAGLIQGIVYAPLNKQAMRLGGHEAGDELDFFSGRLPAPGAVGEINILDALWTSRVTSHVPLRAVGDLITRNSVGRGINLIDSALKRAGRPQPRIAVAALNPHAGEGGAFGMEEIEVIGPAIAEAQARGVDVQGPFPSDTVFPRAVDGAYDGVVTMFHDQGQIALKLIGLGKGITLLAGFPIPIATPGHGTAYDIAGTGRARPEGLQAAVELAARMMGAGR